MVYAANARTLFSPRMHIGSNYALLTTVLAFPGVAFVPRELPSEE